MIGGRRADSMGRQRRLAGRRRWRREGPALGAAATPTLDASPLGRELARAGVEVAIVQDVRSTPRRGVDTTPTLDFAVESAPGEHAITILRHPSGALTFHAPDGATTARRGGRAAATQQFRISLPVPTTASRGVVAAAVRVIVVKVRQALIDAAVSAGLHAVAVKAESLWWRQRGLVEGWHRIESTAAGGIGLAKVKPGDLKGGPSLLFLHGTFSDTRGSFEKLLRPEVLARLRQRYQNRIFGFEHFSLSRTPAENARALLDFLPDGTHAFDAVAYSRGGLVLRTMTELPGSAGASAGRFKLDNGVLVAVPNAGTPLANGERWEETFGALATLLEMVPDNPLTTAAAFVADGVVWLAGHLVGDLPGLEAMNPTGETIGALQAPADGSPDYSAIGANFHPSQSVWQKLVDAGFDHFFAGANDLVVPSDGAINVDTGPRRVIPPERLACFGPGGNLSAPAGNVHHLNILGQGETATFVVHALQGEAQQLPVIDVSHALPFRAHWRGATVPALMRSRGAPAARPPGPAASRAAEVTQVTLAQNTVDLEGDRTLHLMIIDSPSRQGAAQIVAIYGSARIVEPLELRNTDGKAGAGTRYQQIIRVDTSIQMNLEGRASKRSGLVPKLPDDPGLRAFGDLLFEALFTARVRRLYDLARAEQRGRPLNVVFTCAIPWVAAKPWEFAFDSNRKKFLATEEIHFVRNVMTAVPAQRPREHVDRLRMLVIGAQPVGTAELDLDEEERQIRFRFQRLVDDGMMEVDVIAQATPAKVHGKLVSAELEGRTYDIVHFMGHGEFDSEASQGKLIFSNGDDGYQPIDTQTLRELFCNRGVQLIFLNACDTARDAIDQENRGVASALMQGGIPAVVANQYKVLDPSAIAFAEQFYWSLANGATLGQAAREARIAVNYSIDGEIIDWAVPVLYARDPDRRLCINTGVVKPLKQHVAAKRAAVARGMSPVSRQQRADGTLHVGIADLCRFFTGLPEMLARLNAVQRRFEFRVVDVVTPMGVWQRDETEGKTYLIAERVADKLKDRPKALGVDLLSCVTNWWMREENIANIYGWRSGDARVPVLIFSTAGLALPTSGPAAGRVVANMLVTGLGAQLAESNGKAAAMHARKPTDCPFYYNEERDVESVAGRLHICAASRKMLAKSLPASIDRPRTIGAFDALLGAFDESAPRSSTALREKAKKPRKKPAKKPAGKSR